MKKPPRFAYIFLVAHKYTNFNTLPFQGLDTHTQTPRDKHKMPTRFNAHMHTGVVTLQKKNENLKSTGAMKTKEHRIATLSKYSDETRQIYKGFFVLVYFIHLVTRVLYYYQSF